MMFLDAGERGVRFSSLAGRVEIGVSFLEESASILCEEL